MTLLPWYIVILLLNLVIGLSKRKSVPLAFMTVIFLGVVMIGSDADPDMINYANHYAQLYSWENVLSHSEALFWGGAYLFKLAGFDIYCFKAAVFFASCGLVYFGLSKYCENWNLLLGICMAYVFIRDIIQWRAFFALAIFIAAFHFLMPKDRHPAKYFLCICIASLIHSSFVLMFLPMVLYLKSRKLAAGIVAIASILLLLISLLFPGQIIQTLISEFAGRRAEEYSNTTRGMGWIIAVLFFCSNVAISAYGYRNVDRLTTLSADKRAFVKTLFLINMMLAVALPLCLSSINFSRAFRYVYMLDIALATIFIQRQSFLNSNVYILHFIILLNLAVWGYFDFFVISDWTTAVMPIFESNRIIGI